MITSRKDLFYKIYNELVNEGIILENNNNFDDEYFQKRLFVRTLADVLEDYHILNELKELE